MTNFYILLAAIAGAWLFSLVSGAIAFRWSLRPVPGRFWAVIALALFTLFIGYLGLTRFNVSYSRTTNGSHWGIQSKWFFILTLILGALSVAFGIWNRKRF